jgi:hypothetical protein
MKVLAGAPMQSRCALENWLCFARRCDGPPVTEGIACSAVRERFISAGRHGERLGGTIESITRTMRSFLSGEAAVHLKPQHLGPLNFYVAAGNDILRLPRQAIISTVSVIALPFGEAAPFPAFSCSPIQACALCHF